MRVSVVVSNTFCTARASILTVLSVEQEAAAAAAATKLECNNDNSSLNRSPVSFSFSLLLLLLHVMLLPFSLLFYRLVFLVLDRRPFFSLLSLSIPAQYLADVWLCADVRLNVCRPVVECWRNYQDFARGRTLRGDAFIIGHHVTCVSIRIVLPVWGDDNRTYSSGFMSNNQKTKRKKYETQNCSICSTNVFSAARYVPRSEIVPIVLYVYCFHRSRSFSSFCSHFDLYSSLVFFCCWFEMCWNSKCNSEFPCVCRAWRNHLKHKQYGMDSSCRMAIWHWSTIGKVYSHIRRSGRVSRSKEMHHLLFFCRQPYRDALRIDEDGGMQIVTRVRRVISAAHFMPLHFHWITHRFYSISYHELILIPRLIIFENDLLQMGKILQLQQKKARQRTSFIKHAKNDSRAIEKKATLISRRTHKHMVSKWNFRKVLSERSDESRQEQFRWKMKWNDNFENKLQNVECEMTTIEFVSVIFASKPAKRAMRASTLLPDPYSSFSTRANVMRTICLFRIARESTNCCKGLVYEIWALFGCVNIGATSFHI